MFKTAGFILILIMLGSSGIVLAEGDGLGPIIESFSFAPLPAGSHELRYYSTNTVAPGCGSIVWNVTGSNSVVFSVFSSLDDSTWGLIKSAF